MSLGILGRGGIALGKIAELVLVVRKLDPVKAMVGETLKWEK